MPYHGVGMLEMTRKDMARMKSPKWLNDQMVNMSIAIMVDR